MAETHERQTLTEEDRKYARIRLMLLKEELGRILSQIEFEERILQMP